MRSVRTRLTVVLTVLALLLGMIPLSVFAQGEGTATLTVVHGIEGAPPVDVYAGEPSGNPLIVGLSFGDRVTLEVPAVEYNFFVTPQGVLGPVLMQAEGLMLEAGESYTITAITDADGGLALDFVHEMAEAPMEMGTEEPMEMATEEPMEMGTEEPTELPSLLDAAAANEDFSTLVQAVTAAPPEILEMLSGPGPFTVFAPTNAAFEALPPGMLDTVLNSPPSLRGVLLGHVVPGRALTAEDLSPGAEFETAIPGFLLAVSEVEGEIVLLAGETPIAFGDVIEVSNGAIVVIEGVIVPPRPDQEPSEMGTEEPMEMATEEPVEAATEEAVEAATEEAMEMGNIRQVADANELTFIGEAVDLFGVGSILEQEGPITLFAPNDDAFNAILNQLLELSNTPQVAIQTLRLHIVEGEITAEDVMSAAESGEALMSLAGVPLTFELVDGNVVVNGSATILQSDLMASNGVIHVLDAVLFLPEEEPVEAATEEAMEMATEEPVEAATEEAMEMATEEPVEAATEEAMEMATEEAAELPSLLDAAQANEDFSILVEAITAAPPIVVETLSDEGPFTVFAPTNAAFEGLPDGILETVLNSPPSLQGILFSHVVPEVALTAEDLVDGAEFETNLPGFMLSIRVEAAEDEGAEDMIYVVYGDDAEVLVSEIIEVSNGTIIVIDGVIIPPMRPNGANEEGRPSEAATEAPMEMATEAATEVAE